MHILSWCAIRDLCALCRLASGGDWPADWQSTIVQYFCICKVKEYRVVAVYMSARSNVSHFLSGPNFSPTSKCPSLLLPITMFFLLQQRHDANLFIYCPHILFACILPSFAYIFLPPPPLTFHVRVRVVQCRGSGFDRANNIICLLRSKFRIRTVI